MPNLVPVLFALIPVLAGLLVKAYNRLGLRLFFYYCILAFVAELLFFFTSYKGINNHWIAIFFLLFEYVLLCLNFKNWFDKRWFSSLAIFMIILFVGIWSVNLFTSENRLSSWIFLIEHVVLSILAAIFLISYTTDHNIHSLKDYRFWVSAGVLLFMSSSQIMYSMLTLFKSKHYSIGLMNYFEVFTWTLNSFTYSIYSYAFLCQYQKKS